MRRVVTDLKFWMTAPNEPLWVPHARRRGDSIRQRRRGVNPRVGGEGFTAADQKGPVDVVWHDRPFIQVDVQEVCWDSLPTGLDEASDPFVLKKTLPLAGADRDEVSAWPGVVAGEKTDQAATASWLHRSRPRMPRPAPATEMRVHAIPHCSCRGHRPSDPSHRRRGRGDWGLVSRIVSP